MHVKMKQENADILNLSMSMDIAHLLMIGNLYLKQYMSIGLT